MTFLPQSSVSVATEATLESLDLLLERLVPSAEPGVVFTSLARLCVPAFSDVCTVEVDEDERASYLVDPAGIAGEATADPLPSPSGGRVTTSFDGAAHGVSSYRGIARFAWRHRPAEPIDAVIGRVVIGRAVALIAEERLAERARQAHSAADNLRIALASSREIGNAVGILMVAYKQTAEAAFDMLKELSQRSNRRVLDIARDVVATGSLDRD